MAIVNRKQLAVTLGVSERWVRQLRDDGVLRSSDEFGICFDEEAASKAFQEWRRQSELSRLKRSQAVRLTRFMAGIWTLTDEERAKLKDELDKGVRRDGSHP
jgi:hypothetical protein